MTDNEKNEKAETSSTISPVWCVAANIRERNYLSEGINQNRRGTKNFNAGAKIYLAGTFWGPGARRVIVIGHYRGRGYITTVVYTRHIEKWRPEMVYSPTIIARLKDVPVGDAFKWDGSQEAKVRAEQFAARFNEYSNELYAKYVTRLQAFLSDPSDEVARNQD